MAKSDFATAAADRVPACVFAEITARDTNGACQILRIRLAANAGFS